MSIVARCVSRVPRFGLLPARVDYMSAPFYKVIYNHISERIQYKDMLVEPRYIEQTTEMNGVLKKLVYYSIYVGLLVAVALIMTMVLYSPFNRHPDEQLHYASAQYYFNHWLPPAVDDPLLQKVYRQTPWGVSYLNTLDVCYLGAAKFAVLTSFLGIKSYSGLRLFQASLLLLLLVLGLLYPNRPSMALLLLTPQVWYVFSYMNGDAFPFFLSMALCIFFGGTKESFSEYIKQGGRLLFIKFGFFYMIDIFHGTLFRSNIGGRFQIHNGRLIP